MQYLLLSFVLLAGMVTSVLMRKLTLPAALLGGMTGFVLFLGTGWEGVILMAAFFIMGTGATSWHRVTKDRYGTAEKNRGQRRAGQVFANAGVAGICALLAWIFPYRQETFGLMMAASFSAAAADTLSSELGSVYGRKFINIISFKPDQRGLDGVVSLEGFLWGLAGSMAIALIDGLFTGFGPRFFRILIAGTAGNLADSLLGATLERRNILHNNAVNFMNTLVAAVVGGIC